MKPIAFLAALVVGATVAAPSIAQDRGVKNVILMISDGIGFNGWLAADYYLGRAGQQPYQVDRPDGTASHVYGVSHDALNLIDEAGRWDAAFDHDAEFMTIDGLRLPFVGTRDLSALPLDGADVVIDCTGVFKSEAKLAPYFEAGVKKVVVSAPVKDGPAANVVFGVNDDAYDPARHSIATAASCTTNCFAPVVKVIHETIGIRHGSITTIQDVTNTQTIVDRPAKDLRRATGGDLSADGGSRSRRPPGPDETAEGSPSLD